MALAESLAPENKTERYARKPGKIERFVLTLPQIDQDAFWDALGDELWPCHSIATALVAEGLQVSDPSVRRLRLDLKAGLL